METHTTYEEYLDSQITDTDMYYLESEDLARQLVELGYRGSGDTLKREEFEARKKALRERSTQNVRGPPTTNHRQPPPPFPFLTLSNLSAPQTNVPKQLSSHGRDLSDSPLLLVLANREELVRNGKLTTIIFIRNKNAKKQGGPGWGSWAGGGLASGRAWPRP